MPYLCLEWEGYRECAACTNLTLNGHGAAHGTAEFLCNGKTKARTAVFSLRGTIDLPELLEDIFSGVRRNANTGVCDAEREPGIVKAVQAQQDPAVLCKLEGVT